METEWVITVVPNGRVRYESGKWETLGKPVDIYAAKRWKTKRGAERWLEARPGYGHGAIVQTKAVHVTYSKQAVSGGKKVKRIEY